MLTTRRVTSLGVALLLSGVAVIATQNWMRAEVARATAVARASSAPATTLRVLVARNPLPAGTLLKPEHLRWQPWPAGASTAGYFTDASASLAGLSGYVARSDLGPGEPLTTARVVKPGDRSFLAAVLKPGYRAVALNVSASTGVAGFIFPGDRVDVILTRVLPAGVQQRVETRTVLTDIRVVGVDQEVSNPKSEIAVPQTATLEVTPAQAEFIAAAGDIGKLSLSLRSLAAGEAPAAPLAISNAPPAPRAPAPRHAAPASPAAVEVVRGGQFSSGGTAS